MVKAQLWRLSLGLSWFCTMLCGGVQAAELAIVIDDVGYSKTRGEQAIQLPAEVTLAVLPFAPHTHALLQQARTQAHDIIVHQPMQPMASNHARYEHDTLMLEMPQAEFRARVLRALDAVPGRVGISNHTGSLLTAHWEPMLQIMQQLRERNLFFLDSRTTARTVVVRAADEVGVVALQRDVFLDNERSSSAIHRQFEKAISKARQRGFAIAIGHPYPESLEYLQRRLAALPTDVQLVRISELARRHQAVLDQEPDITSPRISLGQ